MRLIAGLFASVVVSLIIMGMLIMPRHLPGVPDNPRFKNAAANGDVTTYYWVGTLKEEWTTAGGRAEGPMTQYYPTGSVMRDLNYADNRPHGEATEYFEPQRDSAARRPRRGVRMPPRSAHPAVGARGEVKSEWTFREGVREGPYWIYWASGTLKEEGVYTNGRKTAVRRHPGAPGEDTFWKSLLQ